VDQGAREGQAVTGPDGVPLDLVEPELHLALQDVDGLLAVVVVAALGAAARLDQVHMGLEQLGPDRQRLDPDPPIAGVQDRALGRLDQAPRRPVLVPEQVGDTDLQSHRQPLQASQRCVPGAALDRRQVRHRQAGQFGGLAQAQPAAVAGRAQHLTEGRLALGRRARPLR